MYKFQYKKPFTKFLSSTLLVSTFLVSSSHIYADSVSLDKYNKVLDYVKTMGEDIYCYWDIKKEQSNVDWDVIINNARGQLSEDTTDLEFKALLREVAAGVKDGHVNYIDVTARPLYYLPIDITEINGEYFIAKLDNEKLKSYNIDLKAGDKIISFNGEPIQSVVDFRKKFQSASRDKALTSYTTASLRSWPYYFGVPKDTVKLTIERDSSYQQLTTELPWFIYSLDEQEQSSMKKSLSDIVQSKILPGNIGLLKLTAMYNEVGAEKHIAYINKQLDNLQNTNALIIDVRDNGGGFGEIGDSIVGRLIDQKVLRYKKQLKNSNQLYYARPHLLQDFSQTDAKYNQYSEWVDSVIEPNTNAKKYDKPVFVLVNERCFSACDTFVDSFSSNHLGEVLGTQSGGGTGYPLWIDLPWGMGNFRFSVMRGYSNHDRYLEGTGTISDIEVLPDVEGLKSGIDTQLLKVVNYIHSKVNKANKQMSDKLASESMEVFKTVSKDNDQIVPYEVQERFWHKAQSVE